MARSERKALMEEIEGIRKSRVLAYVTGDRQPAQAQIGDDAVRPMYEHLRALAHVPRLDLFVYSRGGAIDVPWRLVTALRQVSDEWNILIPFRANSAATLLALGADSIVLGPQGELGPIDPIMNIQRMVPQPGGQGTLIQDNVNVEDVMAYVRFVKERAGLSDQEALSVGLSRLAERLDAVSLGNAYRTHSHIRDVARRLLLARKEPASEQTVAVIVETLAEKVYVHGHAIGFREAEELGLPVVKAESALDLAMWSLLTDFEAEMKLLEPLDPIDAISSRDTYQEQGTIAAIESTWGSHAFRGQIEIKGKRQIPANLSVALNLNLQLPQNINVQQLPAALQQMLQSAQQALLQQAQLAVQEAMEKQAPLVGVEAGFRGGRWMKTD